MKAAVLRGQALVVDEVSDPRPKPGQVLARTLACGICGSDLHALAHGEQMVAMGRALATPGNPMQPRIMDLSRDVVMGHEFAAEVVELGENTGNCRVGDVVVSMPVTFDADGVYLIGYANEYPGGFAELLVLSDALALKVPNGLARQGVPRFTEPMAVGVHAVNKSGIAAGDAAVVLGCGPVGLAVISALRLRGIEPIVAADLSTKRRALAARFGAHEVVDPRQEPAVDAWRRVDGVRPLVLFEAVGVTGMLDAAMAAAPRNARILVVGVCMETDTIRPMLGIGRELSIQFALGYDPMEFVATLADLAEGRVDADAMITGSVTIEGVPAAFGDLADPEAHAKILVEPGAVSGGG